MIQEGVLSIGATGNLGATSVANTLVINGGTATVNAHATTNFGTSETLAALNIGAGAVATLTATPALAGVAVVPEPSALALAGLGVWLLGGHRRRNGRRTPDFP